MKYLWIWSSLIVGNVIYQALFAATPDYRVVIERGYWQGSALFVAWLMGGFQE